MMSKTLTCCDGTGWTGVEWDPCGEHDLLPGSILWDLDLD